MNEMTTIEVSVGKTLKKRNGSKLKNRKLIKE